MLSRSEMALAVAWLEVGLDRSKDQSKSMFVDKALRQQRAAEAQKLEQIIMTLNEMKAQYLPVDPDTMGELVISVRKYKEWVLEQFECAELTSEDCVAAMYHIGLVAGHLELGFITQEDMDTIEMWVEEME